MKKQKKYANNKGITLIALVITMLVLLILAGVSISMLIGENAILLQAQNAKKLSENAEAKEKVELEVLASYGNNGRLDLTKLVANLKNVGTVTKSTFPVEVTVDGRLFTINNSGDVEPVRSQISTSNLKITTVADKETEITTSSATKPKEGTPLEISFSVSISEGTITGVDKGILQNGKVTYDTDGTETEVTFTFTLSGVDSDTPNTVTINNLSSYYKAKLYGAQVQLNGGKPITVKGSNTIEDNWRLFYIDDAADGYVHLIYGDYYPANVQTEITNGNTIFAPAAESNDATNRKGWSVNSTTDRLTLVKYLKNNVNYAEGNLDTSTPAGSYESWTNLSTALTGTGKALNGKTILVQGAPNITMWKNSWNEQGYTEVALDDDYGYYNTETGNISLSGDTNGYSDTLYFPYKNSTAGNGNADKAIRLLVGFCRGQLCRCVQCALRRMVDW